MKAIIEYSSFKKARSAEINTLEDLIVLQKKENNTSLILEEIDGLLTIKV